MYFTIYNTDSAYTWISNALTEQSFSLFSSRKFQCTFVNTTKCLRWKRNKKTHSTGLKRFSSHFRSVNERQGGLFFFSTFIKFRKYVLMNYFWWCDFFPIEQSALNRSTYYLFINKNKFEHLSIIKIKQTILKKILSTSKHKFYNYICDSYYLYDLENIITFTHSISLILSKSSLWIAKILEIQCLNGCYRIRNSHLK